MPVSLSELENDVLFSKRQACIQSEVGPRKSSYGFGGVLLASQQGPGRNHSKIKHLKHFHDIGEPRFLQWIDQEFSKRGLSQGSRMKQNVKLAYVCNS